MKYLAARADATPLRAGFVLAMPKERCSETGVPTR
jgi:hypothetical protein